jgi:proline dehydrogenase
MRQNKSLAQLSLCLIQSIRPVPEYGLPWGFPLRTLLLFLAQHEGFKNFALKFSFFRKAALRFVAGDTLDDAVKTVREANRNGISGTLDLLGENTVSREDAAKAVREIVGIFDRIRTEKIDCNVSIKLTQLGLDLDTNFCEQNLLQIVGHAHDCGNFVRVDMEDSHYTQRTLDLVSRAHKLFENVGTVVQTYLFRSDQDVAKLLEERIRIRLVKGAYLESEKIAFKKKRETDANFLKLAKKLLQSDTYHAIATHDEALISAIEVFARGRNIPKNHFEFQMLLGVRRDLQQNLRQQGYQVRVYIPYGHRWFPYFMRRLAERPANVAFIVRNLFR